MDIAVVIAIVGVALGYIGWKVWGMVKPGPQASGCNCSGTRGGCGNCPLVKR